MLKGIALVVWCYWSEQWCLCLLKSSPVSTVVKWVKLDRRFCFFREVRSKNELIPTACHTILINRPVSEVIPFPISRQYVSKTFLKTAGGRCYSTNFVLSRYRTWGPITALTSLICCKIIWPFQLVQRASHCTAGFYFVIMMITLNFTSAHGCLKQFPLFFFFNLFSTLTGVSELD